MRKVLTILPWVPALAYAIPSPFIALSSSEGWGYLILTVFTLPAGYVFGWLSQSIHAGLFGDPVDMSIDFQSMQMRVTTYRVSEFVIFVIGGTLWYFAVGLALRWVLRRVLLRNDSRVDNIPA